MRQQGAWKLHPYNFIIQNCLITVILTNPDKFKAQIATVICPFLQQHHMQLLIPPPYHTAHGIYQQFSPYVTFLTTTKHINTLIQVILHSTFFFQTMCSLIYFLSTFYPFFDYPVLNFLNAITLQNLSSYSSLCKFYFTLYYFSNIIA